MRRVVLASFALLAACAAPAAARSPASPPAAAPTPLSSSPAPVPVTDVHRRFGEARVAAARAAADGDFDRAASKLVDLMPVLVAHPELPDEFWAHNTLMMLRTAAGDPASALAENDQATLAAARGSWDPDNRGKLALQKDRWHRAYLTRMLAESRSGSAKQALVAYAVASLEEYRPIGFPESIAVLEAYFAALDGKKDAALAAARKIDPAKDDDVEDLYLVVVGLEAGGDHAAAEAVRRVMRRPAPVGVARAVMLRWLDLDAQQQGFTPWHASSPPIR